MNFHDALSAALRYSADTVTNLLTQLQQPEQNEHRWGTDGGQQGLRHVLADAMDESQRHTEADLLRQQGQHVMVHEGRVRPAKFTTHRIRRAASQYANTIDNHIGYDPLEGVELDTTDSGGYREEDFDEPFEPLKKGELRFIRLFDGDLNAHQKVHHSELGNTLADHIKHDADGNEAWDDINELSDDEEERLKRQEQALRNAPYEEIDTAHPTERPQSA